MNKRGEGEIGYLIGAVIGLLIVLGIGKMFSDIDLHIKPKEKIVKEAECKEPIWVEVNSMASGDYWIEACLGETKDGLTEISYAGKKQFNDLADIKTRPRTIQP